MDVALHKPDTIYSLRHSPSWFLLAGSAGAVNGFAFITSQQFVTHVTGTVTRVGLEWPHVGVAAEYVAILASFVAGALASVLWIQARAYQGKRPRWASPLIAVVAILVAVAFGGQVGLFGSFMGQVTTDQPPFIMLSALAFSMGLQNAAVGSTTGLAVRTTHLTGPATDLGTHLGTAFFTTGKERSSALKGAFLRGGKIISFMIGAGLSLPLARSFGFLALLAPAASVLIASLLSFEPDFTPEDENHTPYGPD